MTLFERFAATKEEGFRNDFIHPLLIKLGFIGITNKHGSQEFGKDFVFSELDRFGHLRHMVVQAKHEESLSQGGKIDVLLSQVRQAFLVPFTLPSSPNEERFVSTVYVFNSGTITENAVTQLRRSLPKEIASNTHFFAGDQLKTLFGVLTSTQDRQTRQRLNALIQQLDLNVKIWRDTAAGLLSTPPKLDRRGAIVHGLETYFTMPLLPDLETLNEVGKVWQESKQIQASLMRLALLTPAEVPQEVSMLQQFLASADLHSRLLAAKLGAALDAMHPDTFE